MTDILFPTYFRPDGSVLTRISAKQTVLLSKHTGLWRLFEPIYFRRRGKRNSLHTLSPVPFLQKVKNKYSALAAESRNRFFFLALAEFVRHMTISEMCPCEIRSKHILVHPAPIPYFDMYRTVDRLWSGRRDWLLYIYKQYTAVHE